MITGTKPPSRRWRVAETGTERDDAKPYSSQNKAYEAVRALTAEGKAVTIWRWEPHVWWVYERLDANGEAL